jgi:GDP-L-fucose synthase
VKVLVTGGSGFVGRNLRRLLAPGFEILAPTRGEMDLLDGRGVRTWLGEHRVDAVVHAATTPGHRNARPDPDLALKNLRMLENLLECRALFGPMVVLGSGAAYGTSRSLVRVREEELGAHVPEDQTGFSKLLMARLGERIPGVVHLLPFGVFGPHEDWEIRFISNAIAKTLHGLPVTLRQNRRFDYVAVSDLASLVALFLERDARHPFYNVTPDASADLLDLARLAVELSGKDVPIHVAAEGRGLEYTGDNARLRAEFPDFTFTPLPGAVRALRDWYRANPGLVQREALLVDK